MKFRDLTFQEIDDNQTQAALSLDCGFKIQVIYDKDERVYNAKMYNPEGSVIDSEEGLDKAGVEEFVESSEEMVEEYKEIMEDCLVLS